MSRDIIYRHDPRTGLTYAIRDGDLAERAEQIVMLRGRVQAARRFRAQRRAARLPGLGHASPA